MSIEPIEDQLAITLASDDLETRLDAIARVARAPEIRLTGLALARMVECLGAGRKVVQRRAADALATVAPHDHRVAAALRAALDSGDPRMRWGAAYTLGSVGGALDSRAQKALLEALANPDGDLRWAAADLIVRLGVESRDEIRRGLVSLANHADHNARKMAIYCLRDLKIGDPEVRATVERASRAAEASVRLAALSLLAHLPDAGGEAAQIALRCLKSDPQPGVRRAAAIALGRLGANRPIVAQALERATHDDDPLLSKAARQALRKLEQSNRRAGPDSIAGSNRNEPR